jgi:hypothetical protein
MLRRALALAVALVVGAFAPSAAAVNAGWENNLGQGVGPPTVDPGRRVSYGFTALTASPVVSGPGCAVVDFTFDKDAVGVDTAATAAVLACPDSESLIANCSVVASLVADQQTFRATQKPAFFRVNPLVIPASGTAVVTAYCADDAVSNPGVTMLRYAGAGALVVAVNQCLPTTRISAIACTGVGRDITRGYSVAAGTLIRSITCQRTLTTGWQAGDSVQWGASVTDGAAQTDLAATVTLTHEQGASTSQRATFSPPVIVPVTGELRIRVRAFVDGAGADLLAHGTCDIGIEGEVIAQAAPVVFVDETTIQYGQSNATGSGETGPTPVPDVLVSEAVAFKANNTGTAPLYAWAAARDHTRFSAFCGAWPACSMFSPWPSFARYRRDVHGAGLQALIGTGVTASSLVRGGSNGDGYLGVSGAGYAQHKAIIASARARGPYAVTPSVVLMDQGGADGSSAVTFQEYFDAATLLTNTEATLGRVYLWADAIRLPPPDVNAGWEEILQATRAVVTQNVSAFRGPPLWDLAVEADGIHRGDQQLDVAGERWAEYYEAFIRLNEPPRVEDVRAAGVSKYWPFGPTGISAQQVATASGGTPLSIDCVATDANGDQILYTWEVYTENEVTDCSAGSFSSTSVPAPTWMPPNVTQTCWLRCHARDAIAGDVGILRVDVTAI